MKRRDYELIARALRDVVIVRSLEASNQWRRDAEAIADALATEKPAFDRDLFLTNCGVIEPCKS